MPDNAALQTKLGVRFKKVALLETALTHRSYLNEHRKGVSEHNERLEFLGDAVLELVVTNFLYTTYKDPEGILTNWRSALVKTESLAETGHKLEVASFIKMSRGEARGAPRAHEQIMANAVEAIIGAIYMDQGYEVVAGFINTHICSKLPDIIASGTWQDAKTKYQEMTQERESLTPNYKVLSEEGPDHNKVFTVGVYVGKSLRGKGSGSSKQIAQQAAAEVALTAKKA